jgi:DNA-binding CsgD family transcriptional regulator
VRKLTAREKEILFWTSYGKTAWEIATILGISKRTVEWHLSNIRQRNDANNITHMVSKLIRAGIIAIWGVGMACVGIQAAEIVGHIHIYNNLVGNIL